MNNSNDTSSANQRHTIRSAIVSRALTLALGATLLAASSAVLAQPGWGGDPQSQAMNGPRYGAKHGAMSRRSIGPESTMLGDLAKATERLDLDPEQETRIRAVFDDARDQMQANRQATVELRDELRGIVTAEPFDEDALADAAEREGDLSAERVMIAGTASASILATLTEEQRAELELMREEARERMRERRGSRRG